MNEISETLVGINQRFSLAGLMAVLIALLTLSYQSTRASLMNPVERLRSE
ncbi:MAG: hypothetical protein H7Z75_07060 [Ferruginibacter sp.]|nr:hypothetical protein [Cytophagales bacterium]